MLGSSLTPGLFWLDRHKTFAARRIIDTILPALQQSKLKGKLHVVAGSDDTYYLDVAVDNLKDFLKTTDYGGYVEIHAGDHGNYRGPELMDRFNREMAEHFAAGLKASPEPSARPQRTAP